MINRVHTGVVINPEGAIGHEATVKNFLKKEPAIEWLYEQYKSLYATLDKEEFDEGFKKPMSKKEFINIMTEGNVVWVQLYDYHVNFELFETRLVHRLIITEIEWDTDGEKVKLPKKVVIENPDDELLEDIDGYAEEICDYLSDNYGFCVYDFAVDIE